MKDIENQNLLIVSSNCYDDLITTCSIVTKDKV